MRNLSITVVLVALVSSVSLVAHATVVPECSFDAGTATVSVTIQGGSATLERSGDAITVDGVDCGGTVTTTDSIAVTAAPGDAFTLSLAGGRFEPGLTDEGDGSSEIEITVDGPVMGSLASFTIEGSNEGDTILAGSGPWPAPTATRNTAEAAIFDLDGDEVAPDTDLTIPYWMLWLAGPRPTVNLGDGNDAFSGLGYLGDTPIPFLADLSLSAGPGDDTIEPGAGPHATTSPDSVYDGKGGADVFSFRSLPAPCFAMLVSLGGSMGGDTACDSASFTALHFETLVGHGGVDFLGGEGTQAVHGGAGDDELFDRRGAMDMVGGPGRDVGVWDLDVPGVRVDLRGGTASGAGQDTFRGLEAVYGSRGDDVIYGNAGPNMLNGNDGNDRIYGRAGIDELNGDAGRDRCAADQPGAGESVNCEVVL